MQKGQRVPLYSAVLSVLLFVYAAFSASSSLLASELSIASFNADILGKKKLSHPEIVHHLAAIISRYDIILVQEVRDASEQTAALLLAEVNKRAGQGRYQVSASRRLGRTSSKEQYLYYYRSDRGLNLSAAEVYNDSGDDFERPPYLVKFTRGKQALALISLHARPRSAASELNKLVEVFAYTKQKFAADETLILGDLNADCSYLSDSAYDELALIHQGFTFGISKEMDTTVTDTTCAYDNVVFDSAGVSAVEIFNFQSAFSLDQKAAKAVSNHFPIQFILTL